jgi:uncharacterized cupredoxin-like copper-binding protein
VDVQAKFSRVLCILAIVGTVLTVMLVAATVSASPQRSATTRTAAAERVTARLSEYAVKVGRSSVPSGRITFKVHNKGDVLHELVVVQTNARHDALPRKGDTVKEGGPLKVVDEVEDLKPGKSASLTVRLKPGRYVLLCNLAGHYVAGMHAAFRVT